MRLWSAEIITSLLCKTETDTILLLKNDPNDENFVFLKRFGAYKLVFKLIVLTSIVAHWIQFVSQYAYAI